MRSLSMRAVTVVASMTIMVACGSRSYDRTPPLAARVALYEDVSGSKATFSACFSDPVDQQPEGKKTICPDRSSGTPVGSHCTFYNQALDWGWLDLGTVRLEDQQGRQRRFPRTPDDSYNALGLHDGEFDRHHALTLHAAGGPDADGFAVEFPAVSAPNGEFSYVGAPSLSSGLALSWEKVSTTARLHVSLAHGQQHATCYFDPSSSSRIVDAELLQRFAAGGAVELRIALIIEEEKELEVDGSRFSIKRYRPTVPSQKVALEP
jgi:hypothetical protein